MKFWRDYFRRCLRFEASSAEGKFQSLARPDRCCCAVKFFFSTPVIGLPRATIYLERERFQVLWNDSRHSSWILEIVIRHPLNWILCITDHALGEGPGLDNCSLHLWCLHPSFWVSVLAVSWEIDRNWSMPGIVWLHESIHSDWPVPQ